MRVLVFCRHPELPASTPPAKYSDVEMTEFIPYWDIIENVPAEFRQTSDQALPMEKLDINGGNGQSYGYIVYRKTVSLKAGMVVTLRGHPRDLVQLMVNGVQVNPPIYDLADLGRTFGSWGLRDATFELQDHLEDCETGCTLDFMVENLGRANFGAPHNFEQKKGLWEGEILLDGRALLDWEHIALELRSDWLASPGLTWQPYRAEDNRQPGPRLLRGVLSLTEPPPPGATDYADTFFDYDCAACEDWKHGALFVNGFNVGRYYTAGPQKSLYIPGPLLHQGDNQILVFENYLGSDLLTFTDTPNYGKPSSKSDFHVHNEF